MSSLGNTRSRSTRYEVPRSGGSGSGRQAGSTLGGIESSIFGVPARIERPRIIFMLVVGVLCAFGLLMIYSASSIKALNATGNAAYYLIRQLIFVGVGVACVWVINRLGFEAVMKLVYVIWFVIVALLAATKLIGVVSHGATRWIPIGPFQFQPSEFAKPAVVLVAAALLDELTNSPDLDLGIASPERRNFYLRVFFGVGLPLGLIIIQPDKGSTMILAATLLVMVYLSGAFSGWQILAILVAGVVAFLVVSFSDSYSRQRIFTMMNPWSDPYDTGYQLTQGFMAFGIGNVTGVGVGLSTQKYSYLPEAHNDFIFAIIGEELGFVGTLGVVIAFGALLWSGFEIARNATSPKARLVAAGCTALLIVQFLVNVCGVLGMIPLSGKPIPFLSYGGSAAIAFLIDAGLVISVSRSTDLPETEYERTRKQMREVRDVPGTLDGRGLREGRELRGEGIVSISRRASGSTRGYDSGRRRSGDDDSFDSGAELGGRSSGYGGYAQGGLNGGVTLAGGRSTVSGRSESRAKLRIVGDDGEPIFNSPKAELRVAPRASGPDGASIEGSSARLTRTGGRDRIEMGRTSYDRLRARTEAVEYDVSGSGVGRVTRRR